MVIFIYGPDTYRSRKKISELRDQFMKKRDERGFSIVDLDGEGLTVEWFRKAVYSPSLFSEKRLIVVENLLAKNKDKNLLTEIVNFLKQIRTDRENVVIFWEENLAKNEINKDLVKLLKAGEYVYYFEFLSNFGVEDWIKKETVRRGGKIEPPAVQSLARFFGSDLWRISHEIDKLLAYVNYCRGAPLISAEMVGSLVVSPLEESIWLLVDALADKNKKRAVELLSDQLALGVAFGYIIVMLARQLKIIFSLKEVVKSFPKINVQQAAEKLKLHSYACQKAFSRIQAYQAEEIKKIYQKLVEIDFKSKSSKIDPEVLLDLLIVSL